jgi:DNA invertase Pin-like site-specific DNA recombinase
MRTAVYLRVSTDKQTSENQEPDVMALAAARAGEPAALVYRETESAANVRPEIDRMMEDARLGRFRRQVIWSLDRFGRSMFQNLRDVTELVDRYGVELVSVKESWVEKTADPMLKKLLLAIFSWVAEHERERLRQRTAAGVARARAAGKVVGRPRVEVPPKALAKATELRQEGARRWPWRRVARELERIGLGRWSHATLARACTERVPELDRGRPGFPRRARRASSHV